MTCRSYALAPRLPRLDELLAVGRGECGHHKVSRLQAVVTDGVAACRPWAGGHGRQAHRQQPQQQAPWAAPGRVEPSQSPCHAGGRALHPACNTAWGASKSCTGICPCIVCPVAPPPQITRDSGLLVLFSTQHQSSHTRLRSPQAPHLAHCLCRDSPVPAADADAVLAATNPCSLSSPSTGKQTVPVFKSGAQAPWDGRRSAAGWRSAVAAPWHGGLRLDAGHATGATHRLTHGRLGR